MKSNNELCAVEGCEKPKHRTSRTYCPMHAERVRRHGDPDPYRDLRCKICNGPVRMGQGSPRATCDSEECKRAHQAAKSRRSRAKRMSDPEWRARKAQAMNAWRLANPEEWKLISRRANLKNDYGLSLEGYDALLASQDGGCAICGDRVADESERRLHVDHDHACCPGKAKSCGKCIRGLLCKSCNQGLGSFADDPARLFKAAHYLARSRGQLFAVDE